MDTQKQLIERIEASPYSFSQISREIGVSDQTVYNWKSGKTKMFLEDAIALTEVLTRSF